MAETIRCGTSCPWGGCGESHDEKQGKVSTIKPFSFSVGSADFGDIIDLATYFNLPYNPNGGKHPKIGDIPIPTSLGENSSREPINRVLKSLGTSFGIRPYRRGNSFLFCNKQPGVKKD